MNEGSHMHVARPRIDTTINYGHILQTATLLVTLVGGIVYISAVATEFRKDLAVIEARAGKYIPLVDSLAASQSVQDERIGNLSDAVKDIRRTNSKVLTQLGGIREHLASIKARVNAPPRLN